ncbi:PAS domain-containing protein [Sphingomonas sp. IW22]|uniref:PAS domain-containing protein n=1 Tax=Sphingomonas sp. IW22 TaxID=3242489 RepID=UPI003521DC9E
MALALFGISLAQGEAGYAPLWIANAVATAIMLRFPTLPRIPMLAATGGGLIAANAAIGSPLALTLALAAANVIEIAVAIFLVERFADRDETVFSPRYLAKFMMLAGVTAPIAGAMVGASYLALDLGRNGPYVALHWFAADALGMLVLGPIILVACNPDCLHLLRQGRRAELAVTLLAVAVLTTAIFSQARYPVLFVILPLLTVAAFRLRFMGATGSILIVAAIASWYTMTGHGPISGQFAGMGERLLFLQLFLAIAVVSALPIAASLVERERLVIRLRHRKQQYRLLADHSNDMIVRLSIDGVRQYVSPAARIILDYEPAELVGGRLADDINPDDRELVSAAWAALLDGAESTSATYRQRKRDGSYVWLEAIYRLVRDENGEPMEIIASVRDVTRRRMAELESARAVAKMQESLRLLSMAERMGGIGHWRVDSQNRSLFWSDQVHRIHGRALGDTPAMDNALEIYHPDDRAHVVEVVEGALHDGSPWSFRARIIRPDGEMRQVESSGQSEAAPDGTILGIVGVVRDVTDEAAAEAVLIAARDEARELAETKSAFLATMSHEIRTPMTGVLGMIELLRADPDPKEQARYLENLEQSATLLMALLDDVLDFSKIENGALTLERIDFDVGELARTTLDLFHHTASSKGLNLNLSVPVGRDLRVSGDPVRLRQIVANLVSNAIKFTSAGGVDVTLELKHEDDKRIMRWRVADTGVGIEAEAQTRLFEPFVQADASTTRRFGGTGLGLAICRRLVEAMKGRISVESVPGKGSVFSFEVALDAPGAAAPPVRRIAAVAARSLSILMAEDNAINRALITALVRRDGHEIICVENGRLAVEAAAKSRFDVILMDMQMPEMDGLAATRAIREGDGPNADAPIIALTADAAPERRGLYENAGLTALMTKPVDSAALSEKLRTIAGAPLPAEAPVTQPAPAAPAALVLLNDDKLASLESTVGGALVERFLQMLSDEVSKRPPLIARLIAEGDRAAAGAEAHALKGAALNIGADRIADVANRIETACGTTDPVEALGQELLNAAADTTAAIEQRRIAREAA